MMSERALRRTLAASTQRKWTILDGMVLVAATAVGLLAMRVITAAHLFHEVDRRNPVLSVLDNAIWGTLPLLTTWTLALAIMDRCRPGTGNRRRTRGPGTVACGAATLTMLIECSERIASHLAYQHAYGPVLSAFDDTRQSPLPLFHEAVFQILQSEGQRIPRMLWPGHG